MLFGAVSKSVFCFKLSEKLNGVDIVIESVKRSTYTDIIILYAEICTVIALDFGEYDARRQFPLLLLFGRRRKGFFGFFFVLYLNYAE